MPGAETSSRNSEVIHAGLFYPRGSLKTRLCVEGRRALYRFCAARGVPHRRTGKWVVAQNAAQREGLERVVEHCRALEADFDFGGSSSRSLETIAGAAAAATPDYGDNGLAAPLRWVPPSEAARDEPHVRAAAGALESPATGIVDSHGLMVALRGLLEDAGGEVAVSSAVVAVEPLPFSASSSSAAAGGSTSPGSGGWRLTVRDAATGEDSTIETETLINAAGLGAVDINNMIIDATAAAAAATNPDLADLADRRRTLHCAKGNYWSYSPSTPGAPPRRVSRLIYPAPDPGAGGLGTHLTLDMGGRVRFGPDVEWVDDPADVAVTGDPARLDAALVEINKYLPGVVRADLTPDYAGIRPKLAARQSVGSGKGFNDFHIELERGYHGWVNLLGIESPGLTSCLSIADHVVRLLYGSSAVPRA